MPVKVKQSGARVADEAVVLLQTYLADLPFGTLEPQESQRRDGPDWIGKLHMPTGERLLILQAKTTGQPRTARDAANQLLRWAGEYANAVPILAAPYISPTAADILSREGIGYVDLSGNCRLAFDTVYIRRQDWPNKQVQRRDLRSLYSPKAERVLRILLLEPKRPWKVQTLAQTAAVSIGQASNVKRLLEDREWIAREGEGLVLREPAKLLEGWAQNYQFDRNTVRDFYSLDTPAQIEAKLATACKEAGADYALTGFSSAVRIAPMVRYQRATAYVAASVDDIASRLGLKPVSSGTNVSLIGPYDEGVLAGSRDMGGIRIASAIQTYLDLLSFKGRGEEAAQAVLEQAIKPQW